MSDLPVTDADSSGVRVDKKVLKRLMRRSDRPGLAYLGLWIGLLAGSGAAVHVSLGGWAVVPAMLLYGTLLAVPAYALSHECAHGTAFRSRWLNEAVFWATSLVFMEGPHFRRYAHARHHSYTWIRGKDAQMPFHTPLTLKEWLLEASNVGQYIYDATHLVRNALGRLHPEVCAFTPRSEWPKLVWESRIFLTVYLGGAAAAIATGALWPWVYIVVPRLVGGVVMQLFTIIQHAEMEENNPDIRKSTRSFTTNWLGNFLYVNMSYHVEHHLYPAVPFHAVPRLHAEIRDQLPAPGRGLFGVNLKVLAAVLGRTLKGREALGAGAG